MLFCTPPGHDQQFLLTHSIDIFHLPSNYTNVLVPEEEQGIIVIGPGLSAIDMASIEAMLNIGRIKRLDIICHSESWTLELADALDRCIPVTIPYVTIRVTDPLFATEGVLVRNRDIKRSWAASFTSYIDSFGLTALTSLTKLEVVDFQPPSIPGYFDAVAIRNATQQLCSFFNTHQYANVRHLVLPMNILSVLPELMLAAGQSVCLETLELSASISLQPNHLHHSVDVLRDVIAPTLANAPYLQQIIYPLEWTTVTIIQHFALNTTLSYIRLKSLIGDADGQMSAMMAQMLFAQTQGVDWAAVCTFQQWIFPP